MKKKALVVLMTGVMALGLAACGGSSSSSTTTSTASKTTSTTSTSGSGTTLRLINGKIEVDAQLKELAKAYQAESGVEVVIESMGGGVDIQSQIKNYYAADNMPDIFVNGGSSDFKNWEGLLADMKDAKWVSDTDAAYVDANGAVIGFPYTTEAIGLAYNADILDKAGIDPASLTNPAALKSAFETLDSKKDDLGLTAVIGYCAEPVNLYWSTGNHIFGTYEDAGLKRDDTTYFDLLTKGEIDTDRFAKFADMIALFNQYSDPTLLVSGTYDQQILNFSSGKYAFVTQGSWIGATMTADDKEQYEAAGSFKVGMVPYCFDDGIDTIQTNSPSWWAVYKGKNADAAKAFLEWCAGDKGQEILVKKGGFISPFKSCKYTADDPFAQTISDYVAAGKTSAWHWLDNKEGLAQNYLGQVFADFAQGKIKSTDDFVNVVAQQVKAAYGA
jgi:raffinose/stachyose/melibiose transport system substrate-binding protein